MAWDAWGGSFGSAWGLSWTGDHVVVPPERPLNLGGYFPQRPQPQKQVVRGSVRISGGGRVRVAGRKVYEGASQDEIAMFLMMSN